MFGAIDRAPFSGKFVIGDTLSKYYTIGDKGKNMQFVRSAMLMSFMAAAHAYQARTGADTLVSHLNQFIDTPEKSEAAWFGVDVMYTAAMGAVALRQSDHLVRIGRRHAKWFMKSRSRDFEPTEREPRVKTHRAGALALSVAVTLGGQGAAIASSIDARHGDSVETCVEGWTRTINDIGPYSIQYEDEVYDLHDTASVEAYCNS